MSAALVGSITMPGSCSEPFLPERTITTSTRTECRQGTLEQSLLQSFPHTLHAGFSLWDRLPWCSGFQVEAGIAMLLFPSPWYQLMGAVLGAGSLSSATFCTQASRRFGVLRFPFKGRVWPR